MHLLMRYASDGRSMGPGPSVGLLQLLNPAIRTAVEQHSRFAGEPFQRVVRSIPLIWATMLLPDGEERARRIRDLHVKVDGRLDSGRRYHALDPDTFWWAHACFTWGIFRSVELFHTRRLDEEQAERLYQGTVTWYRRYGLSERPVPPDYPAFRVKFDAICRDGLELTPALQATVDHGTRGLTRSAVGTLGPIGILAFPLGPIINVLVLGCLPDPVRQRFFAYRWTWWRRAAFVVLCRGARLGGAVVPRPLNRAALRTFLRFVGSRTRADRYVVPAGKT